MALECRQPALRRVTGHTTKPLSWRRASLILFALAVSIVSVVSASALTSNYGSLARRADCPAGQTFCDKFGCVKGLQCPHACAYNDDMQACDRVKVNGNQCVWWGSQCIPNVQCSMKEGKCSDDCNLCGGFGCVPRGQQCPTGCEQFTAKDRCNRYVASNGINCFWNPSHNICVYAKSSTVLGELQHEPSAIGGTASPEPPPLDILLAIRRNLLAKRPSLLPDGERILPAQMETLEQAAASNSDNGGDAGRPTSNSIATTGNDRLGAEQSGDNAQSNSNASNGNRSSGTRTSKDNTPTAVSATQPASATSTSDGNDPNNNNNGAMDASLQQSTISGSIKLWVALCGVAVALVAVAGIAFLVVQQRMRARRELLAEQRNAEMHNIHPEHRRESLLPYVQNALRADDMVQTPPTAATANSNNYH